MAGRFSVEAVFKAVDRVTAPVSRMQNRMGKFTRSMERGLRKVNRLLGKTTRMIKGAAAASLKFGGVALVAGAALATRALNVVADAADSLAKRTRRIQFPIKEFQEWQFVAEQSGLTTDEFDKSMEKFTKTIGEARSGTGTLFTILKKTNKPLLRQLQATNNAADAFDIYIKAIRGTENQLDKTALATAAFGRTGAKFLNITEQSAEAVKALRLEQRQNGVITKEQAEAAEAYNDAVNSLKRSLFGMLQQVIMPMLPAITETVRAWREWVISNKEVIGTGITGFLVGIKDAAIGLLDKLQALNQTHGIFERLTEFVTLASDAFAFLAEHGATIAAVIAGVVGLNAVLGILTGILTAVNLVMAANPVTLLVLALVAAVVLIIAAWEPLKAFFIDMWGAITSVFDKGVARIMAIVERVKAAVASVANFGSELGSDISGGVSNAFRDTKSFFGFGDDDENEQRAGSTGPQVVSPQERVARSIEEQRTTSTAEVTIRDETGRAAVTGGRLGTGILLQPSGAF